MPEVNSTWIDYSGEGNDGTITTATKVHNCRFGEGLYFDGLNDSVNIGDVASLEGMSRLTISAWVKGTGAEFGAVVGKWNNVAADRSYQLTFSGFQPVFGVSSTGANYHVERYNTNLNQNQWYHIVCVYPGTEDVTMYIDGALVPMIVHADAGVVAGALDSNACTVYIGRVTADGGLPAYFPGYIDEVLLFDRELAAWEIKALYEQGKPGGL